VYSGSGSGTQFDPPASGAGAHPLISGSGWDTAWNTNLPTNTTFLEDNITCSANYETWTSSAGANETYGINCVNWYEAFAFCIWDGGRLPTEAEWEMATAGGTDNRLYPWGQAIPMASHGNCMSSGNSPFIAVGSYPAGMGRWGHYDLGGNMWEWGLDWYSDSWYDPGPGNPCNNWANLSTDTDRVKRGGSWYHIATNMRSANRAKHGPNNRQYDLGFRCARD